MENPTIAKKPLITKDMLVADIVLKFPSTVPIMLAYGLHCFECGASELETLEEGTIGHGMTQDDLEMILKDINEEAEKEEKENEAKQPEKEKS
ncbi:MAG: DUF1858 domain-containing protein [Candidatus Micrarchaeota archaeon]|nr:DUF1858 domain-containing protein [Candidatus Micrarchaeota archaeon]